MALTTAALTAFFGVVVFVVGQVVLKFFVEPIQEQAKVKGEVSNALVFYANVEGALTTPELREEAKTQLRGLAARLRASVSQIPWYGVFEALRLVPKEKSVMDASAALIGLSNSLSRDDYEAGDRRRKAIAEALGLKHIY